MKVKKTIIFILAFLIMLPITTFAESTLKETEMFHLNGNTILKTTTEAQISNMYGKPKLVTNSPFGGKAMTYHDANFTWILHVETDEQGVIKAVGGIGKDFVGGRYSYGDPWNGTYWFLSGTEYDDWDEGVYGEYNYNATRSEVNNYWSRFEANPNYYKYNLQKHSLLFSKAAAKIENDDFPQTYISEEIYYFNEQLKYNDSNLADYANKTGKDKEIYRFTSTSSTMAFLPNPLTLGKKTAKYVKGADYKYVFYDIDLTQNGNTKGFDATIMYVNPNFMKERKTVELNTYEKNILKNVQANHDLYNYYSQLYQESGSNLFTIPQDYKNLPLQPGVINQNALLMSTAYINMARAGAGLRNLELSNDIATAAQYKATLVLYLNSNGYEGSHYPEKIDAIPQEFYDIAQQYMNENLYTGDILSSIVAALNDGYGDPIAGGHRYNILSPSYTTWGPGMAGGQGVHKFSGYSSSDIELVAWPPKGITPIEMIYYGTGYWTARFYKNYKTDTVNKVTIKNLNNGVTYTIDKNNLASSQGFANPYSRQVSFYDSGIGYEHGDVFEITLHNITDERTNSQTDYTYRSVFYSFNTSSKKEVTDITLNKTEFTLEVNETERILAKITPTDANDKSVRFASSNTRVATIREDGTITALKPGTATITITSGNITKKVTIGVKDENGVVPTYLKGDVNENSVIEIADALEALYYVAGKKTINDTKLAIGDMNENGSIEIIDALEILKIYKNS